MANNLSAPWWIPLLTLIGGLLTAPLYDFLKDRRSARREQEARAETRRAVYLDKHLESQRTNLMILQDTSAEAMSCFMFLINNRFLADPEKTLLTKVEQQNERYRELIWRLGNLTARVSDDEVRRKGRHFTEIVVSSDVLLGKKDRNETIEELYEAYNQLNLFVGQFLRAMDSEAGL